MNRAMDGGVTTFRPGSRTAEDGGERRGDLNLSARQVVPIAQLAQTALAAAGRPQPYSASLERIAQVKLPSTTIKSRAPTAEADAVGAFLLVVGTDSYSTYNLPQDGSLAIGRGETNQVRIDDPLASRNHARLYLGDVMYLEDLGSVNGTRIKNQAVKQGEKIPITAGETISIGASVLIIQHRATARPPLLRPETLRDDQAFSVPISVPQDEVMRRIQQLAERAAAGTINVLVTGETGVGKELLAENVHRLSPRREGPYVCLNC